MEVRSGPETKLRSFQLVQLVLASMRLVKYCKNTRKRVENTVRSQSAFLLCGDFTSPLRHQEKMPLLIFLHFYNSNYIFLWVYYAYILPNIYRVFGKWFEPKAPCWEGAKLVPGPVVVVCYWSTLAVSFHRQTSVQTSEFLNMWNTSSI